MTDASGSSRAARSGGDQDTPRPGRLINRLRQLIGIRNGDASVRETLEELIEDRDEPEAPIEADERELLRNILSLRDVTVYDIMVPRARIVAVERAISFADLMREISEAAHSRLPVYRETIDDVLGMVHIKDVLAAIQRGEAPAVETLLRPVLFVPPSMPALDLLLDMRTKRTHLALVVDEYGGIDGLVTIEDLVEEIVGEIHDEHDDEEMPPIQRLPDGTVLVDASVPIEAIEDLVGPVLHEDEIAEIDTIGGLVISLAGHLPQVGESFTHPSGIIFEVAAADPRRVERVRLRNLPEQPTAAS